MILCPAQPFDLPAVMAIEHSAFIPQVQEKRRVFDERLRLFPQGFFVLADTSEAAVRAHGSAVTAGYFCSELWQAVPAPAFSPEAASSGAVSALSAALPRLLLTQEKAVARQFALGHKAYKTHYRGGSVLYISSFALSPHYRGQGLGEPFFRAALSALCGAYSQLQRLMLVVSEEWLSARRIYDSLGFAPLYVLADFFPSLHKKRADGIVMSSEAASFRSAVTVTNANGAIVIQSTM